MVLVVVEGCRLKQSVSIYCIKSGVRQRKHSLLEADAIGWCCTRWWCSLVLQGVVVLVVLICCGPVRGAVCLYLAVRGRCKGEGGSVLLKRSYVDAQERDSKSVLPLQLHRGGSGMV